MTPTRMESEDLLQCPSCNAVVSRRSFGRDEAYFECDACGIELRRATLAAGGLDAKARRSAAPNRQTRLRPTWITVRRGRSIFAALLIVLGTLGIVGQWLQYLEAQRRTERTIGQVSDVKPVGFGVGRFAYRPYQITFRFTVGLQILTQDRFADKRPDGTTVEIAYEPGNPKNCGLLLPSTERTFELFLMLGLLIGGVLLLYLTTRRRAAAPN